MGQPLSTAQQEARQKGTERATISYLNRRPLLTVGLFTLAAAVTALWLETILSILAQYVFGVERNKLTPWMWLVTATGATMVLLLAVYHLIPIPLTAIFSL